MLNMTQLMGFAISDVPPVTQIAQFNSEMLRITGFQLPPETLVYKHVDAPKVTFAIDVTHRIHPVGHKYQRHVPQDFAEQGGTDLLKWFCPPLKPRDVLRINQRLPTERAEIRNQLKRLPGVGEARDAIARNLRDCRRVSTRMARVARDRLQVECYRLGRMVW